MNKTISMQLKHRSIRKFKDKNIDKNTLNTLFEVANHTASSVALQSYSIIRITDKDKRKELSEICNQPYVETAPELVLFIVDGYRNAKISEAMGQKTHSGNDVDKFFQGFTDGAIACQNMVVAIESLGMGAVYLGSMLNDTRAVIDLLELPKLTFPIVGLGFGYPDEEPQLKPRLDLSLKIFENTYKIEDDYLESIKDYDQKMRTYYDLRDTSKPLDEFSKQVVSRLKDNNEKRSGMLNIIKDQGFNLKLKD